MKINKKNLIAMLFCTAMFVSCKKDNPGGGEQETPDPSLGWHFHTEDFSKYPRHISSNFVSLGKQEDLPSNLDLSAKLPPVGDQGQFGTCVVWTTAYGLRSYLHAVNYNVSTEGLKDKSNQFSPSDLFMSIKAADKTADCGGTNFQAAFDVLVSRGVATMQTAPYVALDCSASPVSAWTNDAENYKIRNYRLIDEKDWTPENFKLQLSQGRIICCGARLGDNFLTWSGSGVLNSETYFRPNVQNAYHAVIIVGYDDKKGANGAFRAYNSWGTHWGDKGYIWIDYDFFIKRFMYCAFVATLNNKIVPNEVFEIDEKDLSNGVELAVHDISDEPFDDPSKKMNRHLYFNVYNTGKETLYAKQRWSVVYMYYNAFNATDYGVLLHLYFTDEVDDIVPFEKTNQHLPLTDGETGYCINRDLPSGKNIAVVCERPDAQYVDEYYNLPELTGDYYLVLIADPFDRVDEANKENNYLFLADSLGYPFRFEDGKIINSTATKSSVATAANTAKLTRSMRNPADRNPNAYSTSEIREMLQMLRNSGELDRKIQRFDATNRRRQNR